MVAKMMLSYIIMSIYIGFWAIVMLLKILINLMESGFFKHKHREHPPKILVEGWKHGTVKLSDINLHYVSDGDDGKPLMLMVHGFPEFWYSWRHQLRQFRNDFKVVAIDLRGYGDSDKPKGKKAYDIDILIKDISEIIPALGYKSSILLAHDWGGVICWKFAELYPQMVDKLIVCNCPQYGVLKRAVAGGDIKQMLKSWYMFALQVPTIPEILFRSQDFAIFEFLHSPPMGCKHGKQAITDEDTEAWKYTFAHPGGLTAAMNHYRQNFWPKRTKDDSKKVQPPVLIIWGTDDAALTKSLAEESMKYCENGTLKYIEGASHWVQQDEPAICNQYIEEFVF